MSTNNRPHNRFVPRSPYHEAVVAEALKHWRWSEWMLAKLRVEKGKAVNNNEEEIIVWHQGNTTTR